MRIVCSLLVVVVALVAAPLRADQVLEYKTVLDGKVRLLVPTDFSVMSADLLEFKYPRDRRPTLVLTNDAASVNIAFNHTASHIRTGELPKLHDAFRKMDRALLAGVEWLRDEIVTINGRDFILREFRSPAIDTDVHNIMAVTSLDGRVLIISFNTVKELEDEWLPTGNRIIESIEILE